MKITIYIHEKTGYNPCLYQAHLSVIFYSLLPIAMTVGGTMPKYERHLQRNKYCLFQATLVWHLYGLSTDHLEEPLAAFGMSLPSGFVVCTQLSAFPCIIGHSSVPGGGSPWLGLSQPYPSPLFYLGPCSNLPGFGEAFRLLWCLIVMKHFFK